MVNAIFGLFRTAKLVSQSREAAQQKLGGLRADPRDGRLLVSAVPRPVGHG